MPKTTIFEDHLVGEDLFRERRDLFCLFLVRDYEKFGFLSNFLQHTETVTCRADFATKN